MIVMGNLKTSLEISHLYKLCEQYKSKYTFIHSSATSKIPVRNDAGTSLISKKLIGDDIALFLSYKQTLVMWDGTKVKSLEF